MIIKHGEEKKVVRPPVFFPPSPPSPSIPCNTSLASKSNGQISPSSPLSFPSVESPYSAPPESFPFVSETFSLINLISEAVDNKISCWWLCPIVRLSDCLIIWFPVCLFVRLSDFGLSVDQLVNYKPLSRTLRSLKTSRCDGIPVFNRWYQMIIMFCYQMIIILCYQLMIILLEELHCTSRSWPTLIISQESKFAIL